MALPGHLYVIEFSDGVVKVGQSGTRSIGGRVRMHMNEGARLGTPAVRHWISPIVDNVQLAETVLIQWCADWPFASQHFGREWFAGLDYEMTVLEAEYLSGPGVAQQELLDRLNRARQAAGLPVVGPPSGQSAVRSERGAGSVRAICTAPDKA